MFSPSNISENRANMHQRDEIWYCYERTRFQKLKKENNHFKRFEKLTWLYTVALLCATPFQQKQVRDVSYLASAATAVATIAETISRKKYIKRELNQLRKERKAWFR